MIKQRFYQSGSALLVALLVVTVVGALGFGLARISLLRSRLHNLDNAAVKAYQAAQSGLQYALLQYSLDKDAEMSFGRNRISGGSVTSPVVSGYSQGGLSGTPNNIEPVRFDLTNNTTQSGSSSSSSLTLNQSFDLTMSNHTYIIGDVSCFAGAYTGFVQCVTRSGHPFSMQNDESFTFNLPDNINNPIVHVRAVQQNPKSNPGTNMNDTSQGVVIFDLSDNPGTNNSEQFKKQVVYNLNYNNDAELISFTGGGNQYQLKENLSTLRKVTVTYIGPANNSDNPLYLSLYVQDSAGSLVPIDSNLVNIDVVGHAEGSSRHLKAVIDRRTNQILHIFDYALYASNALNG